MGAMPVYKYRFNYNFGDYGGEERYVGLPGLRVREDFPDE